MIETERLLLREYTPEDFDALYEILSDPETMRHYPAPFDEARTRGWIAWNLENYETYGFGLWAVTLKETGAFIGDCGLTLQNIDGDMLPEIGYHIHRKHWRQGYAKEAARAVRDWAFRNTAYDALYSYMKYTNAASSATALANGMRKVKEYPDPKNTVSLAYAITRAEWEALGGVEIRLIRQGDAWWDRTIAYARSCPWEAGPFLAGQMAENAFRDWERVAVAAEDGAVAGFCTFTEKDELSEAYDFSPFIGFVFVDEARRGRRISERMIRRVLAYAESIGFRSVYLMSGEHGLYEKYGFVNMGDYPTVFGTTDQLFRMELPAGPGTAVPPNDQEESDENPADARL